MRKIYYPHQHKSYGLVWFFKVLFALLLTTAAGAFAFALSVGIEISYIPQMVSSLSNTLLSFFVLGVIGTCVFYLLRRLHMALISLVIAAISLGVTLYYGETIITVYNKSELAHSIQGGAADAEPDANTAQ